MDYRMMPPPPSTSCPGVLVPAGGSTSGDYSGAGGGVHYHGDTAQSQLFSSEQQQQSSQNASQFNAGQHYKPHFSGRAHVNRPPPLSLHQTYYRDTLTQSPSHTPHYHTDHQQSPHCIVASPHHTQSPLVAHSPRIEQSARGVPQSPHLQPQNTHILQRQSSGQHLVQSPHLNQSPHLANYHGGGEMSPRPTPAHMQQNLYSDRNQSPHSGVAAAAYDQSMSPLHQQHKPRHYSDSSHSPHPYNVHAVAAHLYNNATNPSPHHYTADPSPSPHHFNDPNPSPHHYNEPIPSPFNDPGPHRSSYLDSSQPGTPATAPYSHPGTPAGYVDSPHHVSPHPTRSAYQHFFGPNVPLPIPINGVSGGVAGGDSAPLEMANNGSQFNQPSQLNAADNSQHQVGNNAAMLLTNPGGQRDAMLSAININAQESDSGGLQDAQVGHAETAMDTDWSSVTHQKLKSSSSGSTSFNLFDNGGNPHCVDDLLSQTTDFLANSRTMSLSDAPKEPVKLKPRPKGRPSKNSMSPRSYGAQCPICGKTFNNSSALAKHKLTHSDERKYVCQLCSKAFKRQDHLNGHMMTHRTKKPFECSFEGCSKSYCDARSLRRHLENHHNVPTETLYDMSLTNYGLNGGNMYHVSSTPSPHASPSYPNVPGQQYFGFDQGHPTNPEMDSQLNYSMFSESAAPQPTECTICQKRFKNLPALNGHMRLHGGYVNVKKPEGSENKNNKSDSGSAADANSNKKHHLSSRLQQHSAGNKTFSSASSTGSRDSGVNLMVINNKYNMDQAAMSLSSPSDDHISQSNINQNNNQGNVRQGGDGVNTSNSLPASFLGAGLLHLNTQSSSEPSTFPVNALAVAAAASQFTFSPMDQQRHILNEHFLIQQQQLQRQMQQSGGGPLFPGLPPMLGMNSAHPIPDPLLLDMANRGRVDNFSNGMFMHSPATSKFSDLSMDSSRVYTPGKDKEGHTTPPSSSSFALLSATQDSAEQRKPTPIYHQHAFDQDDHEVSRINYGDEHSYDKERFLAERKRHASAPELPDSKAWQKSLIDQQQQLNEEYAKAQELKLHPTANRRRRSSADNHRLHDFKYPHSHSHISGDLLTRSDGATLFRSPPPGGVKRRKHRPEPLVIPPNVAAVQSRLRSPRIWEPRENHRVSHTGKTPPPYTPPPILSPMRSGTGLFHGLHYRPHTAGVIGLSSSLPAPKLLQLKQEMSIPEEPARVIISQPLEIPKLEPQQSVAECVQEQTDRCSPIPVDVEPTTEPPPLETDIQPHINIGSDHQASLPKLRKNRREAERDTDKATLLWTPECLDHSLTVQELTAYMDFSCSPAVPGSGSNKEYALHQLYFNKGDIKRAILCLMSKKISPSFVKFIADYHYQDSDVWTTEEIELYTHSIMKDDKDFNSITKAFAGRKTHKQCIEFYYLWKKICPDEYKRLRIIRRKRRHDELYNLRSRQKGENAEADPAPPVGPHSDDDEDSISQVSDSGEADDEDMASDAPSSISSVIPRNIVAHLPPQQPPPITYPCEYPGCIAVFNSKPALNGHGKIHVLPRVTAAAAHSGDRVRERSPAPKKVKAEPMPFVPGGEEFPCKLCGKVFYKVKSRSAHMKSHSVLAKKAREAAQIAKQQLQQQQQQQPS